MKRFLLSTLTVLLTMGALTTIASAEQVGRTDSRADLNGDGKVTLHELRLYNRDQRQA